MCVGPCAADLSGLPVNSSLYFVYAAASFNPEKGILLDLSGRGRNATLMSPTPTISVRTSTSALSGQGYAYLQGTSEARILLPVLSARYTLFHVAQYSGPNQGRILVGQPTDGYSAPFVSGFDSGTGNGSGTTSVAYRYGLGIITASNPSAGMAGWLLGTDQHYLYRSQGLDRTLPEVAAQASNTSAPRYGVGPCINCHANVSSEWALAVLLAYSRELSMFEMMQVEDYLAALYDVPLDRVGTPCEQHVLQCTSSSIMEGAACTIGKCACSFHAKRESALQMDLSHMLGYILCQTDMARSQGL